MAWTIVMENEKKELIASIKAEFHSEIIFDKNKNSTFKLLKYLNPYGDTTFNNLQIRDLINDLEILKIKEPNDSILIDEIIKLANSLENEPHMYLTFYGD